MGPEKMTSGRLAIAASPSRGPTIASEAIIYAVGGRHVHTPGTPTSHGEVHSLCTTAEISDRMGPIGSDRIIESNVQITDHLKLAFDQSVIRAN